MDTLSGKRVLLTGATGFLGSALAERLLEEGARVTGLGRNLDRVSYIEKKGVELKKIDIRDKKALKNVIAGQEIIFHTAAVMDSDAETARAVNVEATEDLTRYAAGSGVSRCIFVSTVGAYDMEGKQEVDENTLLALDHPANYPRTKARAEVNAREIAQNSNLELVILRPSMIYGPGNGIWTVGMFKNIKEGNPVYIGDGSANFNPVYLDDVIDALLLSAKVDDAAGEAFNISSEITTWKEFMSHYSELCEKEPKGIPYLFAKILVLANKIPGVNTPLDEGALEMSTSQKEFPVNKARNILGWEPKTGLEEGMQKTLSWLKEKGYAD